MVKTARCMFTVVQGSTDGEGMIKLEAQYDEAMTKEPNSFSKYTPWGNMAFGLNQPNLAGFFEPGKKYYIDITPVEES
jgi:hypothetical protein